MDTNEEKTLDDISALQQRASLGRLCQQAAVYTEQGHPEKALLILERVIRLDPDLVEAHNYRGLVLHRLGRQEAALTAFEQAAERFPGRADVLNYRGLVLADLGRMDEAISSYQSALELRPDHAETYNRLTMLKKVRPGDSIVAAMEALYRHKDIGQQSQILLGFALGKAYDDLGHFARAADCYEKANRLKRESLRFNVREYRDAVSDLCDLFTKEFFDLNKDSGIADETPIFIVGMPRSGTTLLEQILASHPDIDGAGEIPFISRLACQDVPNSGKYPLAWLKTPPPGLLRQKGSEYLRQLRNRAGASAHYITNKTPANFWFIGFIRLILPKARIIHIRRDARDNCLSIFMKNFTDDIPYAYDLTEMGQYYHLYASIMSHWNSVLPGFIHETVYEDLVGNPGREVRRLLDYCDLPFHEGCLRHHENKRAVQTASFAQVRQPLYRDSIGRWRNYEKMLQPLIATLAVS